VNLLVLVEEVLQHVVSIATEIATHQVQLRLGLPTKAVLDASILGFRIISKEWFSLEVAT